MPSRYAVHPGRALVIGTREFMSVISGGIAYSKSRLTKVPWEYPCWLPNNTKQVATAILTRLIFMLIPFLGESSKDIVDQVRLHRNRKPNSKAPRPDKYNVLGSGIGWMEN